MRAPLRGFDAAEWKHNGQDESKDEQEFPHGTPLSS